MCCAACLTSPFRLISKRQHQLGAGIQPNIDALGSPDVLCLEVLDIGRGEDGADGGEYSKEVEEPGPDDGGKSGEGVGIDDGSYSIGGIMKTVGKLKG